MGTVHPIRDQATWRSAAPWKRSSSPSTTLSPGARGGCTPRRCGRCGRSSATATDTAALEPRPGGRWFTRQWGQAAPATWNRNLDAIRSAQRYWQDQEWMNATDLTSALRRRQRAADRSRALSRADVERLLTREDISIRERTLWRLLYETAARSAEVLRLDVEDLDLPNRKAKVRRKGGAIDVIVWQTGTARLLPRLLKGRKTGPVFLTDRRARVQLPPCDIDPASGRARLSYRQAEDLFKAASGGATLHQLRHSALTHDAEAGASTPMLMAKSGHTSVACWPGTRGRQPRPWPAGRSATTRPGGGETLSLRMPRSAGGGPNGDCGSG